MTTEDGKYPLHLVITQQPYGDDIAEEWQCKLVQKLLAECPGAVFQPITEEIRHLRLRDSTAASSSSSSSATTSLPLTDDEQRASAIASSSTSSQFAIHVEKKTWNSLEKVKASSNERVRKYKTKKFLCRNSSNNCFFSTFLPFSSDEIIVSEICRTGDF
jgi:hypothetical protein